MMILSFCRNTTMVDGRKNLIDPLVLDVDVSQETGMYLMNGTTYCFMLRIACQV